MIPRCKFDRGSRVLARLWGEFHVGTVLSAHEWIDHRGKHMQRRMVLLDQGINDWKRWNCALADLVPTDNGDGR